MTDRRPGARQPRYLRPKHKPTLGADRLPSAPPEDLQALGDALDAVAAAHQASHGPTPDRPAVCEDCGLNYELDRAGGPATAHAYTCDDCGGYVDVP